jgi:hypothetical protein
MLNFSAMATLADPELLSASRAQQALRLFADYDLSVPRRLPASLLDAEYDWVPGTTSKLLAKLFRLKLVVPVGRLWMLAPEATWTPASLAEQWRRMELAQQRMALAQCMR